MSFVFESIKPGDLVEQTPEYQQAIKYKVGSFLGRRVVDFEREASLYCLSINDWEERPPGEYLLFYRGQIIRIEAWRQGRSEGEAYVRIFRIVSVDMPQLLHTNRGEIIQILDEAFETFEFEDGKHPPYADAVKVEYMNGWRPPHT